MTEIHVRTYYAAHVVVRVQNGFVVNIIMNRSRMSIHLHQNQPNPADVDENGAARHVTCQMFC